MNKDTGFWLGVLVIVAMVIGSIFYLAAKDIPTAPAVVEANQAAQIQAYRKAMRDGAGVSAVVNGRIVCKALQSSDSECEQYQKLMNSVGSGTVDKLSDESILKLMQTPNVPTTPLPTPTPKGQISA